MSDLLNHWHHMTEVFTARLDVLQPEHWHLPTPCSAWDIRQLVEHVVDVQRRLPKALNAPADIDLELGHHPQQVWPRILAAAQAALTAPGALEQQVESPMGPMPAANRLQIAIADLLAHTWDLSRATGVDESLPVEIVERAFNFMQPLDGMLRGPRLSKKRRFFGQILASCWPRSYYIGMPKITGFWARTRRSKKWARTMGFLDGLAWTWHVGRQD